MRGMGSFRLAASIVVLAVTLAGCGEQSRVDPNAVIRVTGVAHQPNGAGPLAGRPVQLGTDITEGELGFALMTVGLSCTTGACGGKRFDTSTKPDGTFEVQLKGSDTQSGFGEAKPVLVTTSAAPSASQVSGASIAASFKVQTENIRLPDLRLVDPALALAGDTEVRATWTAAAPGPYTLTFETADPVPAWRAVSAGPAAAVDPRLLEDTFGRAVLAAESSDQIEGSDVKIRWRSPGVAFAAGAGPPPSRGRACQFADASGAVSSPVTSCDLTDGDLSTSGSTPPVCPPGQTASTTSCTQATTAVISLGKPVPAELVVVRGCEGGCAVEASADGTTFVPVGSVSDDFGQVALDGRPVTAVRVGLGSGPNMREVSVWGPRPATPALKPLAAGDKGNLRGEFGIGDTDGKGTSRWLLAGAALLALVVLAAAAYTLGRRRAAPPSPA